MFRRSSQASKPNTTPKKPVSFGFGKMVKKKGGKKKKKNQGSDDDKYAEGPETPDSDYEDSNNVPVDDDSERIEVYVDNEDDDTDKPDNRNPPESDEGVADMLEKYSTLKETVQEPEPPTEPVMPAPTTGLSDEERRARARKAVEERKAERRRKTRMEMERRRNKDSDGKTSVATEEEQEQRVTPTEKSDKKDDMRENRKRAIEEEERLQKERERQRVIEEERLQKEKELQEKKEEEEELRRIEEALEREAEHAKNEAKLRVIEEERLEKEKELQEKQEEEEELRRIEEALEREAEDAKNEAKLAAEWDETQKEDSQLDKSGKRVGSVEVVPRAKDDVTVESVESDELKAEEEEGRINFEKAEEERKGLKSQEEARVHFEESEEQTERKPNEVESLATENVGDENIASLIDQFITPDKEVDSKEDEALHVGDVIEDASPEDDFDSFLDDVFNAPSPLPSPEKKKNDTISETKKQTSQTGPKNGVPSGTTNQASRAGRKNSSRTTNQASRSGPRSQRSSESTPKGRLPKRAGNQVSQKPPGPSRNIRPPNLIGKPAIKKAPASYSNRQLPNRGGKPTDGRKRPPSDVRKAPAKNLPRSPRRNNVKIENMPPRDTKKENMTIPPSQRTNPVFNAYYGQSGESRSIAESRSMGTTGSECTITSIPKPPHYYNRPADHPTCDDVYVPNLHPTLAGCQMCIFRLSDSERAEYEKNGRHHLVAMTRGGCRDSKIFPSLRGEEPVRLSKKCFFDTHSIRQKKEEAFTGFGVLGGMQKHISKQARHRGRYKGGRYPSRKYADTGV